MPQQKYNTLDNEPIGVYLQRGLARTNKSKLSIAEINNLLEKYFEEIIDYVLENGTFTIGYIRVRVERLETIRIPKNMREFYVLPKYSSAYSYTIKVSFTEKLKGNYYLKPSKKVLKRLEDKLNSSPDLKLRIYAKKIA